MGDPDQSIYSFLRYAHPEGINTFRETHEGTHDEALVECRRCPRRVDAIADHLIRQNHLGGAGPRLQPFPANPQGEIHIVQWQSLDDEARGLAAFVLHLARDRNVSLGEILVLSPRRLIGYGIRDAISNLEIPVHSFYHEEALEDERAQTSFCLLTLLANPDDRVALRFWLGSGSPTWREGAYRRLRDHCENNRISPLQALEIKMGMRPPSYPSAWLHPRRARFRFARQDHCSFTMSIRLNFRMGPKPFRTAAVLVQREMERGRSPLVSIPPFGRGFSRHEGLPIRCDRLQSAEAKTPRSVCRNRQNRSLLHRSKNQNFHPQGPSSWGAPQGPRKFSPLRHDIAPRPFIFFFLGSKVCSRLSGWSRKR